MADEDDNLVLRHLREFRAAMDTRFASMDTRFDAIDKRLGKVEHNISLLADGMMSLRRDVQTLTIASAGHGERMADVEVRLGHVETRLDSIERHLRVPGSE